MPSMHTKSGSISGVASLHKQYLIFIQRVARRFPFRRRRVFQTERIFPHPRGETAQRRRVRRFVGNYYVSARASFRNERDMIAAQIPHHDFVRRSVKLSAFNDRLIQIRRADLFKIAVFDRADSRAVDDVQITVKIRRRPDGARDGAYAEFCLRLVGAFKMML